MGEMDQGVKRLLQTYAGEILAFAIPGVTAVAPLPPEIAAGPQLIPDAAYTAEYQGSPCVINLEVQLQGDPSMPRRCFEYGSRLSVAYNLPVLSVVLWLERNGQIPEPPYEMRVGDYVAAVWNFTSVKVFDLSARAMISQGRIGLLPLVPFMREAEIPVCEDAANLLLINAPPGQVSDLESLLALFIARFYDADIALTILRRVMMSTEIIEQSPLFQLWRNQGVAIGRETGQIETTRELTRLALESRFGVLADDLVVAIQGADVDTLRQIVARVATISLDEVRQQLNLA